MFKRPLVAIAVGYALLIIVLRPFIPVPEKNYSQQSPTGPIAAISDRFMSVIKLTTPAPYDALLGSIVFGTSVSPLDPDLKDSYKKAGLAHLLVASGTQVSILIGVCLAIVRSCDLPIGIGVILTSLANILFALIAGCGPSIIRAAVTGEITLIGLWSNKDTEAYTSLALSALILMVHDPLVLFDLGFQLTFAATWSLFYLAPRIEEKIRSSFHTGKLSVFPSLASVCLAPILATIPITMFNFNQFSLVAFFVNLLVLPCVEVMTVLGFASTVIGAIFLPVAAALNGFLYLMLILINEIVYTFTGFPGACLYVAAPPFIAFVVYYLVLALYFEGKARMKNMIRFAAVAGAILVLASSLAPVIASRQLKVTAIDVGQGDSIFVEAPSGHTMLIDGGPKYKNSDAGRRFVLPFLHAHGINKIDILVLTHPHDDHVGGLVSVMKDLPVGLVLDSGQAHTSRAYLDFLKTIDRKNIPYKVARAGLNIDLGPEMKATVLNPQEPFIEESALNNNSVVIRLVYGKTSFMLDGDLEKEGEQRVMRFANGLRTTILKAGHHGSRTASSQEYLDAVRPEAALISVGVKNQYHHPHPSTLKKFEAMGIKIYRTDRNGNIEVSTDGVKYSILTQK
ncbi:MAG TPA: DNA internalization-related competence protein ComEC/Rec2 [Candidatus Omnitrophota bacterium]|nr:DNA internalization-related competence protein ComEC/Rec2 [Candidatus Omnitrophota bacterium]